MSSMEQGGVPGSTQSGAGQRQLDPQEEAKAASRDALQAQEDAQEAMKRAYMKQMTAQQKAVQASQQVAAQQENCKMAATLAAREAAQKAASEQKEISEKEMHETSIAQEAAHNALASYAGNQASNHLGPSTFTNQPTQPTGFNANTGAIADSPKAQMHQGYPVSGGVQQNQAQPMVHDSSNFQSAKLCQQMLMQAANQMGVSAASQMAAAQNLATSATDPHSQQVAREQGEVAQQQMTLASQLAAAAQAPDSAVQAAANLPGLLNMA